MTKLWAWIKSWFVTPPQPVPPQPPPEPKPPEDDPYGYLELYQKAQVLDTHKFAVNSQVSRILANREQYDTVEAATGVPWDVVACIHSLESDLNFSTHLHNGDPLTARTYHVPKGRPLIGSPPFDWYESAIDALTMDTTVKPDVWTLISTLDFLERYNGLGYRLYHPGHLSPYLWSYTTVATPGRYVGDGSWSDQSLSQQIGAVCILKRLEELTLVKF